MKKYNSLDLFKFIMAICVVAIHTHPINRTNSNIYNLIVSCAVPFFFMASGFLLQNKITKSGNDSLTYKQYIFKILKMYIIWSLIYMPITIYNFIISPSSNGIIIRFLFLLIKYITIGEQYFSWPLWYLLGSIYSIFIIYVLKKKQVKEKTIHFISLILFAIGYIYTICINNINLFDGGVYKVLNMLKMVFGNSGRILQSLFYINCGMIIFNKVQYLKNLKINNYIYLFIAFTIIESCFFYSELLGTLFNILVFISCIMINLKDNKIYGYLRKTGVVMYFTHMLFYFIFSLVVGFDNNEGIYGFLMSIAMSMVLSIIVIKHRNNKIINTLFN